MKIEGDTSCPHCKKEHTASFDLDKLDIKTPTSPLINAVATGNPQQLLEPKEIIKEVEKITKVSPSDEPFFSCANGNCSKGLHKNPNYSKAPNKKCKNCDSLNGNKKCKNCGNSDEEEFEELDNNELENLGIPLPEEKEHDHNHDEE